MIRQRLGKDLLFFDGGMGTLLQEKGLAPGELPETWNLTHSEEIYKIHRQYIEAGSDIILTNTFGANALKFHDDSCSLEEIIKAAVSHVKKAEREPRMAFINKMDILGADFYNAVDQIKTRLGKNAICLQLPIGKEDDFKGIIDLFEMKAYIYNDDKGDDISIVDIPEAAVYPAAARSRSTKRRRNSPLADIPSTKAITSP